MNTFEVDTWIFFDRDSFNLKGYKYNFCKGTQNLLEIDKTDLHKLKKELSSYHYEWATEGGDKVVFSEDDFEDTYNPFRGLTWEGQD